MLEISNKITSNHLKRNAYLYIRQSTLKQIVENKESTKRQYALQERAKILGWSSEHIIIIDDDQGHSGANISDRKGFQYLVAEVGLCKAGIVLSLEVSRLARNSMEWHRLLEICALTETLILDEDGIYDPGCFNDRLLLGLKGTMSEAELHFIRARLRGGILNKARRGELKLPLPVGFVYDLDDKVALDPNKKVQDTIKSLFKTFERTGSAYLTVRHFCIDGIKFPRRPTYGPNKGEILWGQLTHCQVLNILHNPRYAGIFFYGRTRQIKQLDGGTITQALPKEQWHVFLPESHVNYITQKQFEKNKHQLLKNAHAYDRDQRKSPPREGPALLQGIVICGICGRRMTVRYHKRNGDLVPDYLCQNIGINYAKRICQCIPGANIDKTIDEIIIEKLTPLNLEIVLAVQQEIETHIDEIERLQKKQIEQAQYETDMARRRYMSVDPENRLVADSLETEWNRKLQTLNLVKEEYEQKRKNEQLIINEEQKQEILSLVKDFPKIWHDPKTPVRERKRMVMLLIEDVTLIKNKEIIVNIRFKGGALKTLNLPLPLSDFMARKTKPEIVRLINELLEDFTDDQIVDILNNKGLLTGNGILFTIGSIYRIRKTYNLKNRYIRLKEKGMITFKELVKLLDTNYYFLRKCGLMGLIRTYKYDKRLQNILYEPPSVDFISNIKKKGCHFISNNFKNLIKTTREVQYET